MINLTTLSTPLTPIASLVSTITLYCDFVLDLTSYSHVLIFRMEKTNHHYHSWIMNKDIIQSSSFVTFGSSVFTSNTFSILHHSWLINNISWLLSFLITYHSIHSSFIISWDPSPKTRSIDWWLNCHEEVLCAILRFGTKLALGITRKADHNGPNLLQLRPKEQLKSWATLKQKTSQRHNQSH